MEVKKTKKQKKKTTKKITERAVKSNMFLDIQESELEVDFYEQEYKEDLSYYEDIKRYTDY